MSSVTERLIESWLDNQTERRYQNAFVQMLVSEGWRVLHSTRHAALEFGKDVVARAPDGELYAFQLKGNPGSRLTKNEAQTLVPQIHELTTVPLPKGLRLANEKHHAVLVTNGEIEEESQAMFGLLSDSITPQHAALSFSWWGRGELLRHFLSTADRVWPTSIEGIRALLNFMAADGAELPSFDQYSEIMQATAPVPENKASSASITAALSGLLVVAEIAKSRWYEAQNHYALYQLTVLTTLYASQFIRGQKKRRVVVNEYGAVALTHAADLLGEAMSSGFEPDTIWTSGDVLSDVDIMWHRRNLVAECAAVLLLADYPPNANFDPSYARKLIIASILEPKLWGEGAVVSLIVRYWSVYQWGGIAGELRLGSVLNMIMAASQETVPNVSPFASPYYDFTSCWARAAGVPWMADGGIFEESFTDRSWTARTLMFMLAKRNMKQTCKRLWPDFSMLLHEAMDIDPKHFFDCRLAREGKMLSRTYMGASWTELLDEANQLERRCGFLGDFEGSPWMIAAYVAIVPYRAWEPVMMWLDRKLCRTWY